MTSVLKAALIASLSAMSVVAVAVAASVIPANADTYQSVKINERRDGAIVRRHFGPPVATPGIDRRLNRQTRRILRGFRRGRLSERAVRRLMYRVTDIRLERTFAAIDGHVSRFERRRLRRMLDRNSRRIRRATDRFRPVDYAF